jgi:hypothetical protein
MMQSLQREIVSAIDKHFHDAEDEAEYSKVIVSLVGHRHNDSKSGKDYFGAISADSLPLLVSRVLTSATQKSGLKNVNDFTFRIYVCNAQAKIAEMLPRFEEELKDFQDKFPEKTVTIKASKHEIIPNPFYQNIVLKLDPKFNKYKGKYSVGKTVPKEHKLSDADLVAVSHVRQRVLAREIPKDFKAKNIKDRASMLQESGKFKDTKNHWVKTVVRKGSGGGVHMGGL